jgi:hypothetical protein
MNEKRDDKLTAAARQLATGIRPQRDLWPDIEQAIAEPAESEPRRSRWTPMFAQAAAIVLLVGASSGLTYLAVKDDGPVVISQPAPDYTFERTSFGGSHTLGNDYLDSRADVVARFEQQVERLSPAEREDVERSLEVIRGAIDDINAALLQDPDNTLLQDLLMKTYHEELNVMRKVGGVTQSVMSRRDI